MKKEELIQLIQDKKSAKIAEVSQDFDALLAAADSLEVVVDGGDAALQAQIDELKLQLQAKADELSALAALKAQEDMDLDAAKASVESMMAKLQKDEDALAKFKAILAELSV